MKSFQGQLSVNIYNLTGDIVYTKELNNNTRSLDISSLRAGCYFININKDKYLNPSSMIPVGSIFNEIIDENNLTRNNIRGIYDFVLSGMHYGKPKSIEDQYYKEPWLSADESYGLKKVSRDDVVILYENAKKTKIIKIVLIIKFLLIKFLLFLGLNLSCIIIKLYLHSKIKT